MMKEPLSSRERVFRTLRHEPVDRFPRDLWYLRGVEMFRAVELARLKEAFPMDFVRAPVAFGHSCRERGTPGLIGVYFDAYGSGWQVSQDGLAGEVKFPAIADWDAFDRYQMPWELLDEADFSSVGRFYDDTSRFVIAGSLVNPFERLQQLRGTQNLLIDLADGETKLDRLLAMIHEFNCRCMLLLSHQEVDAVSFMDDWGAQRSLLISPQLWRFIFKPLYKEYVDILHSAGRKAFFHSDGFIEPIFPDLVEIGMDAINCQLFCMDYEALIRMYGHKIVFWGEMDRQRLLPFGTPENVACMAGWIAAAIIDKNCCRTGFIAQCEWGNSDPYENIEALYRQWSAF